jgi:DNA polymerase I-like protein with 3'-5' exonuclease and polymerase domains
LKKLGLAGNYGSSNLSVIDYKLGPLYENKIVNHPVRKQLENKIRSEVRHGARTFYGSFGTPITPEETDKFRKGEQGWMEHLVRCGINNPIQATASELMLFSLDASVRVLDTDGYINYYKHDEGSFYVPEDKVDDLAPKLRECLSYKVKGWIPIGSDLKIGKKSSAFESLF